MTSKLSALTVLLLAGVGNVSAQLTCDLCPGGSLQNPDLVVTFSNSQLEAALGTNQLQCQRGADLLALAPPFFISGGDCRDIQSQGMFVEWWELGHMGLIAFC